MNIDGTTIANKVLGQVTEEIRNSGKELHLVAVVVGDDPGLKKFVELKKKAAESIGIQFSAYKFDGDAEKQKEVVATLKFLADDPSVNGILIELSLPPGWDTQKILDLVPDAKDVDVLSSLAQKDFYNNTAKILPPAVGALKMVIDEHKVSLKGKRVAVFGQGMLVGKPIAHWLKQQGATVDRIDENTPNPERYSLNADVIISGVGKPGLIREDMVKDDAILIDYGFGKKGSKMLGDVNFEAVSKKASLITPVPGGMGPLVIAAVLQNLVELGK